MPTQDMLMVEGPPYMCQVCGSGQIPAWPQYEAHLKSKNHIKKVFNLKIGLHISLTERMQSLGLTDPSVPAPEFQADEADFPSLGGQSASGSSGGAPSRPAQYSQVAPSPAALPPSMFVPPSGASVSSSQPEGFIDNRTQSERSGNVRLAPSFDPSGQGYGMPKYGHVPKSKSAQDLLRAYLSGKSDKLPHQVLNEYCVAMRGSIEYVPTSPKSFGNFAYYIILTIDGVPSEYEAGEAKSKQKAKEEAARLALNVIGRGGGGGGRSASPTGSIASISSQTTTSTIASHSAISLPGDRYADLCQEQLDALLIDVKIASVSKVAAIFLSDSRSAKPTVQLVALGTGSSVNDHCLTEIYDSYGERVIDSTAFICAKRALRIRLAQEVSDFLTGAAHPGGGWLEPNRQGDRLRLKPGLAFHLLLSAPPDGDCSAGDCGIDAAGLGGAAAANGGAVGGVGVDLFSRPSHEEMLRDRCGVLEPDLTRYGSLACYEKWDCSSVRIFSHEEAADPSSLAVHCGSDKLLLSNYLGLQGGLLANFIDPVFLQSVDVAGRYSHADMARGFLCRLPHRMRHRLAADPWLGRTSGRLRLGGDFGEPDSDAAVLSVNWYRPVDGSAGQPEVVDGSEGMKNLRHSLNVKPAELHANPVHGVSRLSKRAALIRITRLVEADLPKSNSIVAEQIRQRIDQKLMDEDLDLNTISLRALKCNDYGQSKRVVFEELMACNRGAWCTKKNHMDPSDFNRC